MNRVNIGCGPTPTPGWINFDNSLSVRLAGHPLIVAGLCRLGILTEGQRKLISATKRSDIRWADATRLIPLPDASVEALYSSHMLEHLDRESARAFLAEVRRVLMPRAVVRIAVPDLRKLVEEYRVDADADAFVEHSLLTRPKPTKLLDRLKYMLVGDRHHQWMYDGESLVRLLAAAGFEDPRVIPAGSTQIADPGPLDLWERVEVSVYVEAFNR